MAGKSTTNATSPILLRLLFAGASVLLPLYGVFVTLSIICLHYLLTNRKRNYILLGYTISSLLASTIFVAASIKSVQLVFVESLITGPASTAVLLARLDLLQRVAYSVVVWLADSLLIYRLWIVWGGDWKVTIVPLILLVGTIATGIGGVAMFWETDEAQTVVDLGVGFHACTVALNVLATGLIAGRLLRHRRFLSRAEVSTNDISNSYVSLLSVFAESGALYSIAGLVYIPLYATNSPYLYVFAGILEATACIAPSLILLRIALGVAVGMTSQTAKLTSISFRTSEGGHVGTLPDAAYEPGLNASSKQLSTRSQRTFVDKATKSLAGDSPTIAYESPLVDSKHSHDDQEIELQDSTRKP